MEFTGSTHPFLYVQKTINAALDECPERATFVLATYNATLSHF